MDLGQILGRVFRKAVPGCLDSMAIYYGLAMPKKLALGVDSRADMWLKRKTRSQGLDFQVSREVRPTV